MSSSKSSQSTSQLDNRRVIGEGGISAEGSSVNVWNETVDRDIVNRALGSVDGVTGKALSFGSDALGFGSEALGYGKAALATAGSAFGDALGFADGVTTRTNTTLANTFGDALGFAGDQSKQFGTLTANAFGDLLSAQESAVAKVLGYGGTMTDRVLDNVGATTDLVKDAYEDAKGRGALTDKMIMAAIAAMALVAFMAVKR